MKTIWETVIHQPGYFGAERSAKYQEYDSQLGVGQWRLAWEIPHVGEVDFSGMCMFYEDAYLHFLRDSLLLTQLVATASDIYDDAESNVDSGLDYMIQETGRTHVQDIAIRRVVARYGLAFRGRQLLQIRDLKGSHPLSVTLSPGRVPFHRQDLMLRPELTGWWACGTVESFYQSNRVVQRKCS